MNTKVDEKRLRVYCPADDVSFSVTRGSKISCENNSHELTKDFPFGEFWGYCCGCRNFWPSDIVQSGNAAQQCICCHHPITRRYLCEHCKVITCEVGNETKYRSYALSETGTPQPFCPGCQRTSTSVPLQHQCAEIDVTFITPLASCPFCLALVNKESPAETKEEAPAATTKVACVKCHALSDTGDQFCKQCGTSLQPAGDFQPAWATPTAAAQATVLPQKTPETVVAAPRIPTPKQPVAPAPSSGNGARKTSVASPAPMKETAPPFGSTGTSDKRSFFKRGGGAVLAVVLVAALITVIWLVQRSLVGSLSPDRNANGAVTPTPATPMSASSRMSYVAGGEFQMGSATGDEYERPPHQVAVRPFFIDKYEVTCEEYARFVKATSHAAPPGWRNGQFPAGAAQQPVTGVNWDDANAYAKWAGKRLPTEAEWEFAARGTDGRLYPWGKEWKVGMANASGGAGGGIADVGTFKGVSPFEAYDMIGNAWEWTGSDLKPYPGGQLASRPAGELKVIRGGSWLEGQEVTATFRGYLLARGSKDYSATGFRCVQDATGKLPTPGK